ncbi:DUF7573 domain-containing protein [Natrinema soli]|uniref:DUF7573 domain-containing protein n=1 Tax=Natrinema soli TaxID=1930624 RepID=A0ABD5SR41_9EURY|nr:hypothetical protein [Natrinema soli]
MTDDATLSDFASDATDESDDDSRTDGDSTAGVDDEPAPETAADPAPETAADPAPDANAGPASGVDSDAPSADADDSTGEAEHSTYAWGEFDCSQCDGATDRVWRSDGDLVCPDCKEW